MQSDNCRRNVRYRPACVKPRSGGVRASGNGRGMERGFWDLGLGTGDWGENKVRRPELIGPRITLIPNP